MLYAAYESSPRCKRIHAYAVFSTASAGQKKRTQPSDKCGEQAKVPRQEQHTVAADKAAHPCLDNHHTPEVPVPSGLYPHTPLPRATIDTEPSTEECKQFRVTVYGQEHRPSPPVADTYSKPLVCASSLEVQAPGFEALNNTTERPASTLPKHDHCTTAYHSSAAAEQQLSCSLLGAHVHAVNALGRNDYQRQHTGSYSSNQGALDEPQASGSERCVQNSVDRASRLPDDVHAVGFRKAEVVPGRGDGFACVATLQRHGDEDPAHGMQNCGSGAGNDMKQPAMIGAVGTRVAAHSSGVGGGVRRQTQLKLGQRGVGIAPASVLQAPPLAVGVHPLFNPCKLLSGVVLCLFLLPFLGLESAECSLL